jgi:hypothetical protein
MTAVDGRTRIAPANTTSDHSEIASGQLRALRTGRRTLSVLAVLLPPVLAGYALFDRGFAYIHIPGTPVFAGEVVMLACVAAALLGTGYVRRGFQRSTVAKVLLVFAAWGVVRTVPFVETYGFNAVRDAALWYYALLAIPVCALVLADPDVLARWTHAYGRFIPWLLVYSPIALFLSKAAGNGFGPKVPGSAISIFDHKGANVSVQVAIALAFLWLIPGAGGRFRLHLTALATIVLLVGATQGRSGFVAAAVGLALVGYFGQGRGRLVFAMGATVLLIVVAAWGLNVRIEGDQGRTISVDQLAENLKSVVGAHSAQAPGNLDANVRFRDQLWSSTLHKVEAEGKVLTGLGFGINIAKAVGLQGQGPVQLRSPHNSHLDIYARHGPDRHRDLDRLLEPVVHDAPEGTIEVPITWPPARDGTRGGFHRRGGRNLGQRLLRPDARESAGRPLALDDRRHRPRSRRDCPPCDRTPSHAGNRAGHLSLGAKTSCSRQNCRCMSRGNRPNTIDAIAPAAVPAARPQAAPSTP